MIKLSIGIPTYNRPEIIKENLKIILKNKSKNIDIVICDNSDNDKTKEVILKLNDNRVKYYKNDNNLKFYGNLLKVFEESDGEYILTLSDEDYIEENNLNNLLEELNKNEEIKLFLLSTKHSNDSYYIKYKDKVLTPKENLENNLFFRTYMSGIIFKKENLIKLKKIPGNMYEELYPHVLMINNYIYNYKYKTISYIYVKKCKKNGANGQPINYILPSSRYEQLKNKLEILNEYPEYIRKLSLRYIAEYIIYILNYKKMKNKLGNSYYDYFKTPIDYDEELRKHFFKGLKLLKFNMLFQKRFFVLQREYALKLFKKLSRL